MRLTRRNFLKLPAAVLLPVGAPAAAAAEGDEFRVLTVGKTALALLPAPAPATAACGFAEAVPGPLLRYKKGESIKIRLKNTAAEPVTFACQGMRIANPMDGVAGLTQEPVLPGGSFDYSFTPPDSGFSWYRSAVLPLTGGQIERGLYGPLIIEEAEPPIADRDVVVVLADWHLDAAAQIETDAGDPPQRGAAATDHYVVTVDGVAPPIALELAPSARLRLRLLSLVQAQLVFVIFAGLRPRIIAIDGQPCEPFEPLRRTIPIGPGACFDLLCDLPAEAGAETMIAWRTGEPSDRPLVIFTTRGARRAALPTIAPLPANPLLPLRIKLQDAHKAELVIEAPAQKSTGKDHAAAPPPERHGSLTLNGMSAQNFSLKPLFSVKRGTPVTLGCSNKTALLMQLHVHGHAFRLLHDLDDGWEPYWRNRVIVPEGRMKHIAFVADNPGKWAIECQTLELRPSSLVAWFEVT
jgi:FtsP/CotA-like multicopper oxidase with cupredoxin domain